MGSDAGPAADDDAVETLVDSIRLSPIATVITDPHRPDNPIVEANPAFTALTGYARDEIVGRGVSVEHVEQSEYESAGRINPQSLIFPARACVKKAR